MKIMQEGIGFHDIICPYCEAKIHFHESEAAKVDTFYVDNDDKCLYCKKCKSYSTVRRNYERDSEWSGKYIDCLACTRRLRLTRDYKFTKDDFMNYRGANSFNCKKCGTRLGGRG